MIGRLRGFTLAELAVVLLIAGLLTGGLLVPLTTQWENRNMAETRKRLDDAREALTGFALANTRLPCPASAVSNGQESFAPGGDASNGNCSNFYDGFLPAATLGITPTDAQGYALDAWNQRIRYAVYREKIGTPTPTFTSANGVRAATMGTVANHAQNIGLLCVCASASGITGNACGSALKLTDKAPAVIYSLGRNGAAGAAGADEAANLNADAVFVFHDPAPAGAANGTFDDVMTWLSLNVLFGRMVAAGQLP